MRSRLCVWRSGQGVTGVRLLQFQPRCPNARWPPNQGRVFLTIYLVPNWKSIVKALIAYCIVFGSFPDQSTGTPSLKCTLSLFYVFSICKSLIEMWQGKKKHRIPRSRPLLIIAVFSGSARVFNSTERRNLISWLTWSAITTTSPQFITDWVHHLSTGNAHLFLHPNNENNVKCRKIYIFLSSLWKYTNSGIKMSSFDNENVEVCPRPTLWCTIFFSECLWEKTHNTSSSKKNRRQHLHSTRHVHGKVAHLTLVRTAAISKAIVLIVSIGTGANHNSIEWRLEQWWRIYLEDKITLDWTDFFQ